MRAASVMWFTERIEASIWGAEIVIADFTDLGDQLHPVKVDVVDPADKGADEGRAGLGRQNSACAGEKQSVTLTRTVRREHLAGLEPVPGQRHLDGDIGGDGDEGGPRGSCSASLETCRLRR